MTHIRISLFETITYWYDEPNPFSLLSLIRNQTQLYRKLADSNVTTLTHQAFLRWRRSHPFCLKERKKRTPDYQPDSTRVSFSCVLFDFPHVFSSVHGFARQGSIPRYGTASLLPGSHATHASIILASRDYGFEYISSRCLDIGSRIVESLIGNLWLL
jgi:hypothetical protein